MNKTIGLLMTTWFALAGCGERSNVDASARPAEPAAATTRAPGEATAPPPSPSIHALPSDGSLAALHRMKGVLDDLDWRCDEPRGVAVRAAAARLRSALSMFRRMCRDAAERATAVGEQDAGEAARRQSRIAQLTQEVRRKLAGCARLSEQERVSLSEAPCDLPMGGGR
jgi:hypothetical protein